MSLCRLLQGTRAFSQLAEGHFCTDGSQGQDAEVERHTRKGHQAAPGGGEPCQGAGGQTFQRELRGWKSQHRRDPDQRDLRTQDEARTLKGRKSTSTAPEPGLSEQRN